MFWALALSLSLVCVGNVGFDEMLKLVGVSIRECEFPRHVYI